MKHTHVIEGASLEDIRVAAQELVTALTTVPQAPTPPPPVPAKEDKKPAAKGKKEAPPKEEPKEEPPTAETTDDEDFLSETTSEKELTETDVREAAKKAVETHGQPAVRDMLQNLFGVKRLADLKSSQFQAFVDACAKLK